MTEKCRREVFRRVTRKFDGRKLEVGGYLDLSSLTSLPEGVVLKAGSVWDGKRYVSVGEFYQLVRSSQ